MGKVISGLIVSIVGGVAVWYLTTQVFVPPSPSSPPPPPPSSPANLAVQGDLAGPYHRDRTNTYEFTIGNLGGTASKPCVLEVRLHKDDGNTWSFLSRKMEKLVHARESWWHVPSIEPDQTLKARGTTGGLQPGLWTLETRLYSEIPTGQNVTPLASHKSFVEAK